MYYWVDCQIVKRAKSSIIKGLVPFGFTFNEMEKLPLVHYRRHRLATVIEIDREIYVIVVLE